MSARRALQVLAAAKPVLYTTLYDQYGFLGARQAAHDSRCRHGAGNAQIVGFSGAFGLRATSPQRRGAKYSRRRKQWATNPIRSRNRLATGVGTNLVALCSGLLDVGLTTEKILLIQKALTGHALETPIYTFAAQVGPNGVSQATQARQVCRQQPRAIICATPMLDAAVFAELEAYQHDGGIVVAYDVAAPLECDQIIFDREDNAYQAARHLIAHGHQHIGIGVSNPHHWSLDDPHSPLSERLRGFRRALAEADLPFRDEWVFLNPTYERGGLEMAHRWLHMTPHPTGLCIVNDYVGLAFMTEVMRAGVRVPQDVSLIGHDNQRVAALCPIPLTSMTQPVEIIAQNVAVRLIKRIEGDSSPPRTTIIKGSLIERQSVGASS